MATEMDLAGQLPLGARGSSSTVVTRELTVAHFHPEMPEVYGTPMMIYLMEEAAGAAAHPYLPAGWVSVGTAVDIRHLAATPVGMRVTAHAELVAVEGRTLRFAVEAFDENEKIGEGTHERVAAPLDKLGARAQRKRAPASES